MNIHHPVRWLHLLIVIGALCAGTSVCRAVVQVAGVFADGMVLQRDARVPVWGWDEPGAEVVVEFAGQKKTVIADGAGRWRTRLDPLTTNSVGESLVVRGRTLAGKESVVTVQDVLVGDVWLCSGQSNMAYPMSALQDTVYAGDLTNAHWPLIRHGAVPREPSVTLRSNTGVRWTKCTPQTVREFTAAGFYFAREIQRQLGVPIGLLHASWGGTSAESWTSREALATVPEFKSRADEQLANLAQLPEQVKNFPSALAAWEKANGRTDDENIGARRGWAKPETDTSDWRVTKINAKWSELGLKHGGIVWLRQEVVLPPAVSGKKFRFDPGLVDEQYLTVYWNGQKVGESGRKAPQFYYGYVNFDVPAELLRPGTNVLALRFVVPVGGKQPFSRRAIQLGFLNLGLKELSDDCLGKVEREFSPLSASALASRPTTPKGDTAHTATTLFGGMIAPLIPFAIKGAVWYQGEQDASRATAYRTLLPLLIRDWRSRWGLEFPFIIQQLPNWNSTNATNTEWAELREAQAWTAANLPGCFLSVGIDLGEANDVHPKNKSEVGRRLALVALANVYGQSVESSGPLFSRMEVDDGKLRVLFKSTSALKSQDGRPLRGFTIAGANQNFFPAVARIEGESVIVSSSDVPRPVAVRYAFINNPEDVNFSNASGLPAMPFRTDAWKGIGRNNK